MGEPLQEETSSCLHDFVYCALGHECWEWAFYRAAGSYKGTHALIAVVYLCERIDGQLALSHEHLDTRYWPIETVSEWHANHRDYAVAAHAVWKRLNAQRKT